MACRCGKGPTHGSIGRLDATLLANKLRDAMSGNTMNMGETVVCVEPDSWTEYPDGATNHAVHHDVAKIVVTFHDVSDVEWLTHLLAQRQAQGGQQ